MALRLRRRDESDLEEPASGCEGTAAGKQALPRHSSSRCKESHVTQASLGPRSRKLPPTPHAVSDAALKNFMLLQEMEPLFPPGLEVQAWTAGPWVWLGDPPVGKADHRKKWCQRLGSPLGHSVF